ncbi:Lrp/AsnC family transcriptional regulator [Noviherbaspirillum agri]
MTKTDTPALTSLEFRLLNAFQRDFPITPRPFAAIGDSVDADEKTVIDTLQRLQDKGLVSRVGAVFRPNAVGVSTLAALAVPRQRLEQVARHVSSRPEVNHNYEREHRYNLWFVATATSAAQLDSALADVERTCACGPLLVLPMLADYHIDLGFDLSAQGIQYGRNAHAGKAPSSAQRQAADLTATEQRLLAALQSGLPLVPRPFSCLGIAEKDAIRIVLRWMDEGVIKRFGVIVRHHELGYTANAMSVWDVPDDVADSIGERIAATGRVTLCYRRPRRPPDWRYNLFCMIHGKDRADVSSRIAALSEACGLGAYPHAVLFSRRRFKQRGAHYSPATATTEAAHG